MKKNGQTKIKDAAICFSGLAKNFELCYPYIKKNLLDLIGNYDIFCCVEDDENANEAELLKPVRIKRVKSSDVDSIIKDELERLKKQNYRTSIFIESFKFNIRNTYQQIYKVNNAFELLEEYIKEKNIQYKQFIRIRFDLLPLDSVKLKDFITEKNEIIVPKIKMQHSPDVFNDMFCVTNSFEAFKSYCSLYGNFKDIVENELSFKASFLQKLYLLFEKNYSSFFFFSLGKLSGKKGFIYRNLLGISLSFPKLFYKDFKHKNKYSSEKVLFYHLKYKKIKIREDKINFVIVRSLTEGLLIFG